VTARLADDLARSRGEIDSEYFLQDLGARDNRTERVRAEKVVAHVVMLRQPRLTGKIRVRIEKIDGLGARRICGVERAAGQRLVPTPGAADVKSCLRMRARVEI
jgi:hypothetical protein